MVNDLLYCLTDLELTSEGLSATFGLMEFAAYALTSDLLEEELLARLAGQGMGPMPLRDIYLPSAEQSTRFSTRFCAGGPACLTAIARPDGDYALLIQQRSARVLNVAGRLAVIPKAFHQPMVDAVTECNMGLPE
jgi:hypothetical protein